MDDKSFLAVLSDVLLVLSLISVATYVPSLIWVLIKLKMKVFMKTGLLLALFAICFILRAGKSILYYFNDNPSEPSPLKTPVSQLLINLLNSISTRLLFLTIFVFVLASYEVMLKLMAENPQHQSLLLKQNRIRRITVFSILLFSEGFSLITKEL